MAVPHHPVDYEANRHYYHENPGYRDYPGYQRGPMAPLPPDARDRRRPGGYDNVPPPRYHPDRRARPPDYPGGPDPAELEAKMREQRGREHAYRRTEAVTMPLVVRETESKERKAVTTDQETKASKKRVKEERKHKHHHKAKETKTAEDAKPRGAPQAEGDPEGEEFGRKERSPREPAAADATPATVVTKEKKHKHKKKKATDEPGGTDEEQARKKKKKKKRELKGASTLAAAERLEAVPDSSPAADGSAVGKPEELSVKSSPTSGAVGGETRRPEECETSADLAKEEEGTEKENVEDPYYEQKERETLREASDPASERKAQDELHVELPELSKWERDELEEEDGRSPPAETPAEDVKETKPSLSSEVLQRAENALMCKPLKTAIVAQTSGRSSGRGARSEERSGAETSSHVREVRENRRERASSRSRERFESNLQVTIIPEKEQRTRTERETAQSKRIKIDRSKFVEKRSESKQDGRARSARGEEEPGRETRSTVAIRSDREERGSRQKCVWTREKDPLQRTVGHARDGRRESKHGHGELYGRDGRRSCDPPRTPEAADRKRHGEERRPSTERSKRPSREGRDGHYRRAREGALGEERQRAGKRWSPERGPEERDARTDDRKVHSRPEQLTATSARGERTDRLRFDPGERLERTARGSSSESARKGRERPERSEPEDGEVERKVSADDKSGALADEAPEKTERVDGGSAEKSAGSEAERTAEGIAEKLVESGDDPGAEGSEKTDVRRGDAGEGRDARKREGTERPKGTVSEKAGQTRCDEKPEQARGEAAGPAEKTQQAHRARPDASEGLRYATVGPPERYERGRREPEPAARRPERAARRPEGKERSDGARQERSQHARIEPPSPRRRSQPSSCRGRKESAQDESRFEPDYDELSEEDSEGGRKAKRKLAETTSAATKRPKVDEEEGELDSSTDSSSDSSEDDRLHRKHKKKHRKHKKHKHKHKKKKRAKKADTGRRTQCV